VYDTGKPGQRSLRDGLISLTGHAYFVTSNAASTGVCLAEPKCAKTVISSLEWLRDRGRIELHAYAVMPDHVHLVLTLGEGDTGADNASAEGVYSAAHQ